MKPRSIFESRSAGYVLGVLGMAAVTAICCALRGVINEMTVALAMLLVVLFVATFYDVGAALVASVVGMLCLNYYFLPPIYTFTIADPKNWVALTAFFITALTAGRLSAWAKQQAAQAEASRSQARLASAYNRSLLEASLDPLVTIGRDGKINDVNAATETATGCSRAELIGSDFSVHFTEPEKAIANCEEVFRGGAVRGYALELRHRSGHTTSVLCDNSLYRDADGNVIGAIAAIHPIATYAGRPSAMGPDARVVRHLRIFVVFASIFSVAVGLLSIIGLVLDIPVLKSVIPGHPVIKMNSAVCLVLLGLSLWLVRAPYHRGKIKKLAAHGMAAIVALVGLLSLIELFGWSASIDQLLFHEPAKDVFHLRPGLMAPITALDFLLLGLALLLLDWSFVSRGRRYWPAQYLASFTAILAVVGLLDFILGSRISYTHIALQTAITLLVVSLGVLCTRTDRGLAAMVASSAAGGVLTRRLLPAAVLIPLVIGALSWHALSAGRYSVWSEVSLMTIAMITLLAGFAILNGFIVNRGDRERQSAEAALHRSEMELREAQRLAQVGSWWWDPKTDRVIWSAGLSHLTWRDPMLPPLTYEEHLKFFTPTSSELLNTCIQRAIRTGACFELELEMVRTDGSIRSVIARGEAERDENGQIMLVRGMIEDITERKQAEREIQLLARLQGVVAELGQKALRSDQSSPVLAEAVILVAQTLSIEYCKVLELLPDGKALLLRAGVGWKEGLVGHATVGAGTDSQAGFTLLSDQPVVVEDLRTEKRFSGPPLLHDHHVVSGMSVVIPTSEGPYGVLGAHTRERRTFTKDEVNFLMSVANVLGMMIERQRADEALQKSADEIRDLYNHAPCGYHSLDPNGVIVRINDTELEWLGYKREEVIGKLRFPDLLTPQSVKTFDISFPQVKATGFIQGFEFEMKRKDGSTFPVLLSATAVTDPSGNYLMSRSTMYDISARKREEEARAQLAAIVEFSDDAIISKSLDGRILTWNKAAERIFGYTSEEIAGRPISILVPPDKRNELQDIMARLKRGESTERLETLRVRKDGQQIFVSLTVSPIRDADGDIIGAATISQDITERKQAEEALRESEANLNRAQEIAHVGSWHLDIASKRLTWSNEVFRIFGVPQGTPLTFESFVQMIHPEDRESVEKAWAAALEGAPYDIEHRIIVGDELKWVRERAEVEFDKAGNARTGIGTVQDITARKRAENEIRQFALQQTAVAELGQEALRSDPFGKVLDEAVARAGEILHVDYARVLELQPDGKTLLLRAGVGWKDGVVGHATVSATPETQAGYTLTSKEPVILEDLRTETRFQSVPMFGDPDVVSGMSVVISAGERDYGILSVHTRERRSFTKDEINFLQSIANVLGITIERRRAEGALLRSNRSLRALSACNQALIRAEDESTLLAQICELIVDQAGYRFCWVGHRDDDEAKTIRPLATAGFEDGYLKTVNITWADTDRGRGPTGMCVRTGEMQLVKNFATDTRLGPWRKEAAKRGYASSVAIPLVVDSKIFGALTIYSGETEAFGTEEVQLLTELADDLGFGITTLHTRAQRERAEQEVRTLNAELEQRVARRTEQLQAANKEIEQAREREIEIGFKIQQTLLLDQPPQDFPGLKVAAMTIPSQRIDGDFYIFIRHSDDYLDVIVGDVMGKGIPAALLGAATKSHFLRAISDLTSLSKDGKVPEPKDIVMLAHAELAPHLIELDSFVTLVYARFDENKRTITLVDCGHTGTIHWHEKSGRCDVLRGDNLPLGVRLGEIYDQFSVPFDPGDLVLFYSDGITEARNPSRELFGAERLVEYVRVNGQLDPRELVEGIREAVLTFSGPEGLTDDLTSVAVRMQEREVPTARAEMDLDSDLRHLRDTREFVRSFCRSVPDPPLDEEGTGALELAVNEAASNIMKHAYHGRSDQRIQIEAEAFPGYVSVRLHHFGDPFDPSSAPAPRLDGSRESGFGAYIISRSVDQVRYCRDDHGRNCVALIKFGKLKRHSERKRP